MGSDLERLAVFRRVRDEMRVYLRQFAQGVILTPTLTIPGYGLREAMDDDWPAVERVLHSAGLPLVGAQGHLIKVQASEELRRACPASAVAMRLLLPYV